MKGFSYSDGRGFYHRLATVAYILDRPLRDIEVDKTLW